MHCLPTQAINSHSLSLHQSPFVFSDCSCYNNRQHINPHIPYSTCHAHTMFSQRINLNSSAVTSSRPNQTVHLANDALFPYAKSISGSITGVRKSARRPTFFSGGASGAANGGTFFSSSTTGLPAAVRSFPAAALARPEAPLTVQRGGWRGQEVNRVKETSSASFSYRHQPAVSFTGIWRPACPSTKLPLVTISV